MKQIIAVIRMDRMNETKRALAEAGIASMTARKVLGRGQGRVKYASALSGDAINPLTPGPKLLPKRLLWISVPDDKKDKVVRTLMAANRTGKPGDGKIFVRTLTEVVRIRTADQNDHALDEQT